jgi:methylenetetrahydrofolate reductase (NADPH)
MRDEGTYLSGRKLDEAPKFFLGAVENPFAPPQDYRPIRMGKKIESGAQFIQTQLVYNIPRMKEFMSKASDLGLLDKTFVLASIGIPRSARGTHYMAEQVPGIDVPAEILDRMDAAPKEKQAEEGVQIGLELVHSLREIPGVAGVHLICIKAPETISRVVKESGLLPRPDFSP